jgi:NAD-dependent dihydropyrimidine dehydrogenase PreA subunit
MGMFIQIEVNDRAMSAPLCALVGTVCPVEIFAVEGGRLLVRPEQVDECTLCELCLDAAPTGAITISRTYSDKKLVSRGSDNSR